MSHDDDTQYAPGPSSKPLEDVAAGSESTRKRKPIEEPQSRENPPLKKQKTNRNSKYNVPQATPQATTSTLPSPVFSGWVQENGQGKPRRPRSRKSANLHPVVAQAQGDSMGNAYGPSQMYSGQGRECDASASSSISSAPTTSVNAQGMGREQISKPDLKRKRKAKDFNLYNTVTPQPRTVVPSAPESMPSPDEIFRQAEELFRDKESAAILTAMHSIRSQTPRPPGQYFEILNPNPPVSIVLPEATLCLRQTILRNHTKILGPFFINILIHFCNSISDIPGVLFSGPGGKVAALLTNKDIVILRNRLMRFQNNMNPQHLSCPSPVSIPDAMRHPKTTLLVPYPVGDHFMVRVLPVTPAPATQNQMHESLYMTVSSSQSSNQVPAQGPILPQDRLSALYPQNTSQPTLNYNQLGLGLAGVQAQQQPDYGSGMDSSFLSPLPLRVPSDLLLNLPVALTPGPSVSGASSFTTPRKSSLPLTLSQVGVSQLSRRPTPAPQPMGMNSATGFSSPHPHLYEGFLQIPETPTTGVPLISQNLGAPGRSTPGTPGGFDYSARESTGAGAGATPAATPAVVDGHDDPDVWLLRYARIRRGGVERLGPVWGLPLRHAQEIWEMTREDYDRMYRYGGHGTGTGTGAGFGSGSGSGLRSVGGVVEGSAGTVTNQRTTTTTGFSGLDHVTDGMPALPQLFSKPEGGLLMQPAAYDVPGRMNGSNSNWDEHANNANVNDTDAPGSGTMALPQLFSSGSGSSSAVDHELDIAVSGVMPQQTSFGTDDPSSSLSGSLDNDVNPPTTDALPDSSSLSNDDKDVPSSVVAAESAGLSERLSELDSWIATSPFAPIGQSDVDDGSWFEQFFAGFDESTPVL